VSVALTALGAGVAQLLDAQGQKALSALVRRGEVELIAPGEPWSMGSRVVTAHRVSLVVSAPDFVAISRAPGDVDTLRAAFTQAMRSPDTELSELYVTLRLPAVMRPWGHVYREADASFTAPRAPAPDEVREGAAALLDALGDKGAAAMVLRAEFDVAEVPDTTPPLRSYVILLSPKDLAAAERDAALGERVKRAVRDAAVRAGEGVVVDLGLARGAGPNRPRRP